MECDLITAIIVYCTSLLSYRLSLPLLAHDMHTLKSTLLSRFNFLIKLIFWVASLHFADLRFFLSALTYRGSVRGSTFFSYILERICNFNFFLCSLISKNRIENGRWNTANNNNNSWIPLSLLAVCAGADAFVQFICCWLHICHTFMNIIL